jgi:catechol 2,3-dioxygenase-like lactoylglutathione lyase family enzyme
MINGINGVHHVSITVPDMQRALDFYCGVLGFEKLVYFEWGNTEVGDASQSIVGTSMADAMRLLKRAHEIDQAEETVGSVAMLRAGNFCVELFNFLKPESVPQDVSRTSRHCGLMHFALDVTNLEELYPRLLAAGVRFHAPPQRTRNLVATYGRDPFGNIIEFQEVLTESAHLPKSSAASAVNG